VGEVAAALRYIFAHPNGTNAADVMAIYDAVSSGGSGSTELDLDVVTQGARIALAIKSASDAPSPPSGPG
jgi:hypothetical protein